MSFSAIAAKKAALQQQCSVQVFLKTATSTKDHQNLSESNTDGEVSETPEEICSVETILHSAQNESKDPEIIPSVIEPQLLQYLTKRDAKGNVKVRNRTYWVVGMLLMGTAFLLINWINFVELSQSSHYHGLLVGPPIHSVWLALLVFTAVGTITFTLESANTVSYMFSGGSTHVPLMFEMTLTILLVHIPLNVLNYCVANCRAAYMTNLQTMSGAFSITFIFTRMLWFAQIEGRHEEIRERSKNLFMASCAFYAIAMAFPITNWRSNKPPSFRGQDLGDISLYLLNDTIAQDKMGLDLKYRRTFYYNNLEYLNIKPTDPLGEYEVANLSYIANDSFNVFTTEFPCTDIYKINLAECQDVKAVKFKFQYSQYTPDGPYGQLRYNYGLIPTVNKKCFASNETFQGTWKLYFFRKKYHRFLNGTIIFTSIFWNSKCLHPQAVYDTSVEVC